MTRDRDRSADAARPLGLDRRQEPGPKASHSKGLVDRLREQRKQGRVYSFLDWDKTVAVDDVIAALSSSCWRGIETAPRDGTEVLLYIEAHDYITTAIYFNDGWCHGDESLDEPTHWKPLDSPPPSEGGKI